MKARSVFCVLVLLGMLLLCSCAERETPSPRKVCEKLAESGVLGDGILYDSRASADDESYLDSKLLGALYARSDGTYDAEDIASVAIYLGSSSREHRELAVFSCRGLDSAREVAALCRSRAAMIGEAGGSEPRILIYGETVVFLAHPDPGRAERMLDAIYK